MKLRFIVIKKAPLKLMMLFPLKPNQINLTN